MTDYELLDLLLQASSQWSQTISLAVGIISAFLVASLFIANKLNRLMTGIFLALYTFLYLTQILGVYWIAQQTASITAEISRRQLDPNSELAFMTIDVPDTVAGSLPTYWALIMLVSYIASMAFFFLAQRRVFEQDSADG